MSDEPAKTPHRALFLGCTSIAGITSVPWDDKHLPNLPDYDLVFVSTPHLTEQFIKTADYDYIKNLRTSIIRLLHSGGRVIALISQNFVTNRKKYPDRLNSDFQSPIHYATISETGKSIVVVDEKFQSYLRRMSQWDFYIFIPRESLTEQLTDFYGQPYNTNYKIPLRPFVTNRYKRVLAGEIHVEVRRDGGESRTADVTTGAIDFIPLIDGVTPEDALSELIQSELGLELSSDEPDWANEIAIPAAQELLPKLEAAEARRDEANVEIEQLKIQIADIQSFRRLLFASGPELESIVKRVTSLI